jgi:hypothetical protein
MKMPDLDPEIWDNPTLGDAATNPRLDQIERQQIEDRAAKYEGREPREIVVENTYPGWQPDTHPRTGTVASNFTPVRFADERPNDVVQTGADMKPEGMSDEEWAGNSTGPEVSEGSETTEDSETPAEPDVDSEPNETDASVAYPVEEGNTES